MFLLQDNIIKTILKKFKPNKTVLAYTRDKFYYGI